MKYGYTQNLSKKGEIFISHHYCFVLQKKKKHEALLGMFVIYSFSSTAFMELKEILQETIISLIVQKMNGRSSTIPSFSCILKWSTLTSNYITLKLQNIMLYLGVLFPHFNTFGYVNFSTDLKLTVLCQPAISSMAPERVVANLSYYCLPLCHMWTSGSDLGTLRSLNLVICLLGVVLNNLLGCPKTTWLSSKLNSAPKLSFKPFS